MEGLTFEYIVKQKNEGGVLLKKLFAVIGYVALFIFLECLHTAFIKLHTRGESYRE